MDLGFFHAGGVTFLFLSRGVLGIFWCEIAIAIEIEIEIEIEIACLLLIGRERDFLLRFVWAHHGSAASAVEFVGVPFG